MSPFPPALQSILRHFPGRRVLIVGDVMLDEYLWGSVQRISPEAPVPIVELHKRSDIPGGAANTAANIAGLGGQVHLAGVVGQDDAGQRLRARLAEQGIAVTGLLVDKCRPTTTKTRIIAHNQQVVRVDQEQRGNFAPALEERLLGFVEEQLPHADACVLSDYAKGVVSSNLARRFIRRATELGKPVVVDPKGTDFAKYQGATLIKPNLHEAGLFLQREVSSLEDVLEAGQRLLALLGVAGVLITRGGAGMSLFEKDTETIHIPAQAREVFDVTGAGDTVAATLTLALASGASLQQAARLSSLAAGVIVGRLGTSAIRLEDLLTG
jgi:D-beta-D-heptose 7-phosphate kinase/D-beta-D-heptose 1-phosphate adenosyltransferase